MLRLLIKPILAVQNICHPSVCRMAAKTIMPIQERGFPQQKCSTAFKLHKTWADSSSCRESQLTALTENVTRSKTQVWIRVNPDRQMSWLKCRMHDQIVYEWLVI